MSLRTVFTNFSKLAALSQRKYSTNASVKTAIITGGARGIGKGIALRLAQEGFDICINDLERNATTAKEVVQEIQSLNRKAITVFADVSSQSQVREMIQTSVGTLGPLNVMVANAGIVEMRLGLELDHSEPGPRGGHVKRTMDINFGGVVNCNVEAAKQFVRQGKGGTILNATSVAAYRASPMQSIYCASKAAVRSVTQTFALEWGKYGITVNAYAPGIVQTPMWDHVDEELSKQNGLPKGENFKNWENGIALGRTSTPKDVAGLVAFLASEDARYITGQTIVIDGGIVFT
ncbi:acetoin dehydrogenase-like protein [Dendrothele bispora CBS 962.96]|uniref:Acetoin dehydrogenase-like protein n=1 Tax=Dendrothele bispora (strain CBS 962.96) TaxID=1314807 RepID=A0A4V4HDC2_DENBC|nr:acetoin dehydrogenase-like protein [Dendrothele bispora CBS 962.96]